MQKRPLGLYFHIPFCKSKCAYCDFYSVVPRNGEICERYVAALISHAKTYAKTCEGYSPDTVFIGGGTPTALPIELLLSLIKSVRHEFDIAKDAEFTVEANPATVTLKDLKRLRRAGVNRISMGLQSADDGELALLSRIHKRRDFEDAFRAARDAKIANINVDVMFGIPGQTVPSVMRTLDYVTSLSPEHISFYNLRIEPGTPFWKNKDSLALPGEDAEYEMYMRAVSFLASRGYGQYEISNFARSGYECRHNLKYWNCDEYLGLGAAAHSFFNGNRFSFCRDAGKYIAGIEDPALAVNITDSSEQIMTRERIGEYVMLRMRLSDGISRREFYHRFGKDFDRMYGRFFKKYIDGGFVVCDGDRYAFTPRGMFVSNYILSDILDFSDMRVYDPTA